MSTSVSTRTPGLTIHPDPCTPGVARARVASSALRAGPVGAVGLELEAHLVDLERPATRVAWERVTAAVAALPPLPGASLVTLEPGGQVELSGPPQADVTAAVAALWAPLCVATASDWRASARTRRDRRRGSTPVTATPPWRHISLPPATAPPAPR